MNSDTFYEEYIIDIKELSDSAAEIITFVYKHYYLADNILVQFINIDLILVIFLILLVILYVYSLVFFVMLGH